MSAFTCINCSVKFANADLHRDHYKSDWHRYNLKRRVAELPPVTAEEFQSRVLQMRNATAEAIEEKQTCLYCNACRKQFGNQRAHDNHLNSKKHKENLVKFTEEQSVASEAGGSSSEIKDVTTKSVIQQRPHPALAAEAAREKMISTVTIGDDDSGDDDVSEEEVRSKRTKIFIPAILSASFSSFLLG